jgi:CheY-like chemotaxis protein
LPEPGKNEEAHVKILLVDNDPIYLNLLAEVLILHSHTVIKATNGEEALDIIQRSPADLVISDVSMPKMNGMNLHRYIRSDEKLKNIPFAWISGYRELRDVLEIENPNVDFILDKAMPIPNLLYFLNHLYLQQKGEIRSAEAVAAA